MEALQQYGCDEIIEEAYTGKTMDRPQFSALLKRLTAGDVLVVCKLERFARSAIEGVQTIRDLFARGVKVNILNMGMIEDTLTGEILWSDLIQTHERAYRLKTP